MKNIAHTLVKLSIVFSLLALLSCSAYKEVEMLGVQNYNIDNITKENVDLAITVKVNNPNDYNIKIKKTALDLFIETNKVGKAQMKEDVVLKKNTNAEYTFVVTADYKELSNGVLKAAPTAIFKNNIRIGAKGRVKAKAFGVGKKFDLDLVDTINIKELMKMVGV